MSEKVLIDKKDFEFLLDLAQDGLFGTYKSDARYPYGKEWNELLDKYNLIVYTRWTSPNKYKEEKSDSNDFELKDLGMIERSKPENQNKKEKLKK